MKERKTKSIEERFLDKVSRQPDGACWVWRGAKNRGGYGVMSLIKCGKKTTIGAHRASYEIYVGEIPSGDVVMHTCDNPSCVNPTHLVSVNQIQNVHDAVDKSRNPHGKTHGMSKISPEDVVSIRREYARKSVSYSKLAEKYSISKAQIGRIISRENWSHIK